MHTQVHAKVLTAKELCRDALIISAWLKEFSEDGGPDVLLRAHELDNAIHLIDVLVVQMVNIFAVRVAEDAELPF